MNHQPRATGNLERRIHDAERNLAMGQTVVIHGAGGAVGPAAVPAIPAQPGRPSGVTLENHPITLRHVGH